MDPLAAIGLVANIFSFVDIGTKVINNARVIYNAASNSTEETQTQELLASKMEGFSQKLLPPITADLSRDEQDLHDLAAECKRLAGDITSFLNKLKPKRKSWRHSMMSAAKNMWYETEMDGLQHRLDNCRNQLDFQWNYVMNSEHREKLDNLIKDTRRDSSQIAELHAQVNQIHQGVNLASLAPESQEQFKQLLSMPEEAFDTIVSDRFLKSLNVSGLSDRFDAVQDAHYKTFKWIFKGTETTDLIPNPNEHVSRPEELFLSGKYSDNRAAKRQQSFISWLSSGDGAFHISGKLGSGKSTLMKFLYKHDCTRELLQHWAEDRELVLASFFFWKLGSKLQRSFDGLVRSLLHESLQSDPALIPLVFPGLWKEAKSVPWQAQTSIDLSLDEIHQGFGRLMHDEDISKRYCFCFFIDGLDEWEEQDKINFDNTDMVHELTKWTECDARNIKICASSREDNAFMNGFSPEKRIRLQYLTRQDMVAFINNRLDFPSSSHELSPYEKQELVYSITTKADGIFLWVALVMRRLRDMVENWASFSQLKTEIGSLPEGIEDLFDHIFRSPKRSVQKIAYQTFVILLRWKELERQWDRGNDLQVWGDSPQLPIPLSAYYFIDKQPLELGYHDTFTITKSSEQFSESDMFEQARRLLMGTCKGLVEVKETGLGPVLSFTHRSVPEFLKFRRDKMNEILRDFNPDKAICQLLLAYVENGLPRSRADHKKLSLFTQRVLKIRHHCQPAPPFQFEERWNAALIELGVTVLPPEHGTFAIPQDIETSTVIAENPNAENSHDIASPLYIAACLAYSAYVKWKIKSDPAVTQSHFQKTLLFWCALHSRGKNINEALSIINALLEHDLHSPILDDLSYSYSLHKYRSNMTNWHHFMLTFMVAPWGECRSALSWAVIQKFLQLGADPRFWLTVEAVISKKIKTARPVWVYKFYTGFERHHCATVSKANQNETALLLDSSEKWNNRTMSFKEIIEASSHEKKQEILLLIDQNMRRLELEENEEPTIRRLLGVLYKYFQWNWAVIWIIGKSTSAALLAHAHPL